MQKVKKKKKKGSNSNFHKQFQLVHLCSQLRTKKQEKILRAPRFCVSLNTTHPLLIPPRYVIIFTSFTAPYLANNSRISFSST